MTNLIVSMYTPDELLNTFRSGLREELQELKEMLSKADNNSTKDDEELLTRKDVANMFSVSLVTVHDWCKANVLKPYKMGRKTFFKKSEVLEVLYNSNRF